jgi:hypothetical protein
MKKILSIITAFFGHVISFTTSKNEHLETENYNDILTHSGLSNFDDNFEDLEDYGGVDDFDGEMFEEFENYTEDFRKRGNTTSRARQLASQRMGNKFGNSWRRAVQSKSKSTLVGGGGLGNMKAQFTVKITRLNLGSATATHTSILPVALFGTVHKATNYSLINALIPQGTTLTSVYVDQALGSIVFLYSNNVTPTSQSMFIISANQTPYATVLETLYTDSFRNGVIRYEVNTADIDQFNTDFKILQKTTYGVVKENQVPVANNRDPKNNQANIIDIKNPFDIDKDTCLVVLVKANPQPFTLSMNLASFYRQDRRTMK